MFSLSKLPKAFDKLKKDTFCPECREFVIGHISTCESCQQSAVMAVEVLFDQIPMLRVLGINKSEAIRKVNEAVVSLKKEAAKRKEKTDGNPES